MVEFYTPIRLWASVCVSTFLDMLKLVKKQMNEVCVNVSFIAFSLGKGPVLLLETTAMNTGGTVTPLRSK